MKRLFSLFSGLLWLLFFCLAPTGSAQSMKPGTEIRVQLIDRLDTGKTQAGEEFSATLAEPVRLENEAVWPKGTEVRGRVVEVVSSGRLQRPASITLQLTQIANSPVETETEQIDGKSHAGRNVALIGGSAAAGAILGAIAGGAKGAVIGTAAGAGAGTVTAAATGKQEIVLPAETPLVFVVAGNTATEPEVSSPAPEPNQADQPQDQYQDSEYYEPYAPEQLDNLLAPIALYPDPLLAQVLVAATFPDQIQDAARWVRVNDPYNIDYQPWDVSVKAVAHYPTVLAMLNDRLDWTTALGQAYVYQSTDIMMSVQRLRNMAYSQGNLIATPQQQVIVDRGYIQIVPAQPRVIFVPVYDPGVIYVRRVYRPGFGFGGFFNFGRGFVIGAWLNYDMDWGSHRVVYEGWEVRRGGWRDRSRPYIRITNVYVNNRYEHVNVNRTVLHRHVDYENVNRYNSVHRDVTYENRARIESRRVRNEPPRANQQPQWQTPNERVDDRDNARDDRHQPSFRGPSPQHERPSEAGFERTRQTPPNVEQPRSQPADVKADDRGNARGEGHQPSFRGPSPQHERPSEAGFERTRQTPPNVEQPRSQPADARVNEKGNDRSIPTQPSPRLEQPARTPPQSPSHAAPAASPAASPAAHHSTEDQPRAQQQRQQQREHGAENKSKDNGEDKK
jgi:hypothetical protein